MLSIFPNLLTYGLLGPALLRLVAAWSLGRHGYASGQMSAPGRRLAGLVEILAALLLAIGLWTQAVALILAILILIRPDRQIPWSARLLLVAILLSLIVTGPGFGALDWPL